MKPKQNTTQITVRILNKDLEKIRKSADNGDLPTISEFIRNAVREKVKRDMEATE